jgi:ABC-2 type transport system ATP-binding protein
MIEVEHLTKTYGRRTAVDDVSFRVEAGEVVGLLGPNGAGKSTTLRILSCYLPPSGGRVRVAGFDVIHESLEVRRRIGYMPENVPLYPEMRVAEYLVFRARLRGVSRRELRPRLDEAIAACGLEDVAGRVIGHISKGYRQRVGLADALVHRPELLILDEPSIGLDPNQIRQIRELIRGFAGRHTVLLSSHILSEVEQVCQRVLILHHGRLVGADTPEQLMNLAHPAVLVEAELRAPAAGAEAALRALPGVRSVALSEAGGWLCARCECEPGSAVPESLFAAARDRGWSLRKLHEDRPRLEDVFANLTAEGQP